jgi:hypothetical protein
MRHYCRYEVAIRDAKEFERQKAEHTIQELKQRSVFYRSVDVVVVL